MANGVGLRLIGNKTIPAGCGLVPLTGGELTIGIGGKNVLGHKWMRSAAYYKQRSIAANCQQPEIIRPKQAASQALLTKESLLSLESTEKKMPLTAGAFSIYLTEPAHATKHACLPLSTHRFSLGSVAG